MPDRRLLLVEADPAASAFLSQRLRQAGLAVLTAPSGREGLIEAWRERADLVIVAAELPDLSGLEVVRKLRADPRTQPIPIILLSAHGLPQDILAGVQAGADEYIVKRPGADTELAERVRALLPAPASGLRPASAPGALVGFLSAKGGTGTSSLCVNLAQLVAQRLPPGSVAVVDLVLPVGSLHYLVGVDTPNRNVVAATRLEAHPLLPGHLRPLITRSPDWGFDVLPGSPDPEAAQALQVERLEAVIGALREMYAAVFIDFGRALSRISLPLLRQAARLVVVTSPDAATAALTKSVLAFLERQNVRRHRLQLLLNRSVGLEGLSRPEMERELGFAISALIPHMGGDLTLANNQRQPLSLRFPDQSAVFTLQSVADGLASELAQPAGEAAAAGRD